MGTVKRRAELVPLFRNGGVASRRLWRHSAKVLRKLGEQCDNKSQEPVAAGAGHSIARSRKHSLETLDWRSVSY